MNFYDFHIGDYASRTAHLEPMEDLAYRRMLDLYYVREEPLPADVHEIARLIRLRDDASTIGAMLSEFFTFDDQRGWIHGKCEEVIAAVQDKRSKAQASANKRWHSEGNADAMRSECEGNAPSPSPSPTTQSHKKPPKPPKGEPVGFAEWYAEYPKKQARPSAAKAFAKVTAHLPVLLAALVWQRKQQAWTMDAGKWIPLPATYLNDERWTDQQAVDVASTTVPTNPAAIYKPEPSFTAEQLTANKARMAREFAKLQGAH